MSRNFFLILIFIGVSALSIYAQSDKCNLELKFFEYNLENSKIPVSGLDVSVVNLESDKKENVRVELSSFLFLDKPNGKYKVKIQKSEFKERIKEFEVDCKFADKNNYFVVQIYLAAKNNTDIREEFASKIKDGQGFKFKENNKKVESLPKEEIDKKEFDVITVAVKIDIDGNVESAEAIEGNPSLYKRTIVAARNMKFPPTFLEGVPANVSGNVVYNYQKKLK